MKALFISGVVLQVLVIVMQVISMCYNFHLYQVSVLLYATAMAMINAYWLNQELKA